MRIWRALAGVAARGGTLTRYALADRDAQEPAGPEGRGHDFHRGSHPPLHLIRERTIPEHREDKNDRDKSDDHDEATRLRLLASPPISVSTPPCESKRAGHAKGARLAVLCVLAVFVILFGAGWAAISLDIIRVELLPAGAELLKQVEVLLAGTLTER